MEALTSVGQYRAVIGQDGPEKPLVLVVAWAALNPHTVPGGQLQTAVGQLLTAYPHVKAYSVDAEGAEDVADELGVENVPEFVFIRDGAVSERVVGSGIPAVAAALSRLAGPPPKACGSCSSAAAKQELDVDPSLQAKLERLTTANPVMVFMKGTPQEPRCKFSRALVALLAETEVAYGAVNILEQQDVRAGLKTFGGLKTYPQVWVRGELLGGGDRCKELAAEGTLRETLAPPAAAAPASGGGSGGCCRGGDAPCACAAGAPAKPEGCCGGKGGCGRA